LRSRWLLIALCFGLASCRKAPHTAPRPEGPSTASYEVRLGRETYRHYCLTCHGDSGAGDGFNAFNLDPHPRDLSDPAFQRRKTDADLADVIRRGGSGVGLSALMPPWGHTLTPRQIQDVVLYVRSLGRPALPPAGKAQPGP
jgi:mono/diheme cytochrome c family protein